MNVRVHNSYHRDAPPGAVYIGRGRGSTWGNPYEIGVHGDRTEVIAAHRADLFASAAELRRARDELAGKPLVCFCAPSACHGDTLAWVANCPDELFAWVLACTEWGTSRAAITHYLASTADAVGAMSDDSRERRAASKRVAAEIELLNRTHPEDAATIARGYCIGAGADVTDVGAVEVVLSTDLFAGKKAHLNADQVRALAHGVAPFSR